MCKLASGYRIGNDGCHVIDQFLGDGQGRIQPVRRWVLSFPFQLRFLFASRPLITGQVLGIVYRVISMHLVKKAGCWKIGSPLWCSNVDSQVTASRCGH